MTIRIDRHTPASRSATSACGSSTLEAKTLNLLAREPDALATYISDIASCGSEAARRIARTVRDEVGVSPAAAPGGAPDEAQPIFPPDSVEPLDPADPREGAD